MTTHKENQAWRDGLSAGDEIAVRGNHSLSILEVTRTTRTQVVAGSRNGVGQAYETKWRRNDGREVGGSAWFGSRITQATGDVIGEIAATAIRSEYDDIRHRQFPQSVMVKILDIVTAYDTATKEAAQ